MKKLLSICFLSILLGLLSFSAQAQNCGFLIKNLQPDTIPTHLGISEGVAQMSPDGLLPLEHTLGSGVFINPNSPLDYYGNANVGRTELYELFFCNTCNLDPKTKISLDWILQREVNGEWVEVNEHLSDYVDFNIYTLYSEINDTTGVCNRITWLGGRVPDAMGYCVEAVAPDMFHGITCNTPVNYPGAVPVGQGTPYSVMNSIGQLIPAMGMTPIYTEALDYFYYDFFSQTRTLLQLTWRQAGNYRLIMNVRERVGGTAWNNLTWNENETTDFIGGHQSCCGEILSTDTLTYPIFDTVKHAVCDNNIWEYGRPTFVFNQPDENGVYPNRNFDTLVVFGEIIGEGDCSVFHTDSIHYVDFFVRHTPVMQIDNATLCKCASFDEDDLFDLATQDVSSPDHPVITIQWLIDGVWSDNVPSVENLNSPGVNTFTVRQINTYDDTLQCVSEPVTFTLTFLELPAPEITSEDQEFCNDGAETTATLTATLPSTTCASTVVWYRKNGNNWDSVYTGLNYTVTLADLRPETNIDKTIIFKAKAYDGHGCYSTDYSGTVSIIFHQTPVVVLSADSVVCPGGVIALEANVTSTQTDAPYTYAWTSIPTSGNNTITRVNASNTTKKDNATRTTTTVCHATYTTVVSVTDANGCNAKDTVTVTSNDTENPVVTPVSSRDTINACKVTAENTPKYTTVAAAKAALHFEVEDNCGLVDLVSCVDSLDSTDCDHILTRVYTFADKCGNQATFTQIVVAHDQNAPTFLDPQTSSIPYVRMIPIRDTACTFNAPAKSAFVHEILGYVHDDCTEMDSLYLMNNADFYWENSELFGHIEAPGTVNIFGHLVGNQLTVRVIVTDKCGNRAESMMLYFNRPDSLFIEDPSITVDPANICLGETATLSFDSSKVITDPDFELASPLTFAWSNLEHMVDFTPANAVVTEVTPAIGDMTYHFQMTVTDAYGCTATSEYAPLFVKNNPNVKIVKDVRNGAIEPYCPNYGDLTIEAVDAVTETKIPNLRYTWSGESVNVNASIEDTSFIVIVPDYCDYLYTAFVHVEDTIYGCVGDASITVWAADTAGPVYTGDVINDTVAIQDSCKMFVPDFIHYLNNANIIDNCYLFSEFKDSFRQVPAEGTPMTEDTPVTIYVMTPCDTAEYAIEDMFFARVPKYRLHVTATVDTNQLCEPGLFTFTAVPDHGNGTINYTWTKANSDWTANGQVVTNIDTVVAGALSSTYTYTVKAVDALLCEATSSVNVTVFKTIINIDTLTKPNHNCLPPWDGQFIVYHAPIGTTYELTRPDFYMIRTSEVPGWDPQVTENTLIFDYLHQGNYLLTVTTPNGCQSTFDVYVPGKPGNVQFNDEVTPVRPTYCNNSNGALLIDAEPGYIYEVYGPDGLLVASPYTDLYSGVYTIVKTSIATQCDDTTHVTIPESNTTLRFPVTSTANTLCGDEEYNGHVAFTTTGWNYTVTDLTTNTVIYTGVATTLDTLAEGQYKVAGIHVQSDCPFDTTVTVGNGRNNPVFHAETAPNNYCENEQGIVNGKITITPASTYTYTVTDAANQVVSHIDSLASGDYHVVALNEANNCWSDTNVTITDLTKLPTYQTTSTENTSCNPDVTPYNGTATITITGTTGNFNTYIKNYTIVFDGDTTSNISTKNKTFSGLNSGIYNFTIISKFLCQVDGEVEVEQHQYPPIAMHATPNTMCEPTFEKPGNGTIVMDSVTTENGYVYYRDTIFDYSFYFAEYDAANNKYVAGTQLQVNYFIPISYTMYYLKDSLYYVVVYDKLNGCDVTGTIRVPLGRDSIAVETESTPNKNCKAPYDGTLTINATSYKLGTDQINEDAVLMYKIETTGFSRDFQLSNVFTGVKDGLYNVTVRDTVTRCEYFFQGIAEVGKTESDIVITPTITPNHACQIEDETTTPWDGTISAVASSVIFENPEWYYKFYSVDSLGVHWHKLADATYGTVHAWDSLEAGSYHVIARDSVSGCEQDSLFTITTQNICAPEIDFESFNHNKRPFHFCLNTEDARICAIATTTDPDCPVTDYDYKWHVDCHDLDYTGRCIDIPTDEVHCCTYTVTVTSLATGCKSVSSIEVCIDRVHQIDFLVNDVPFPWTPINTTFDNCVNKDAKIGVVHNGWERAWWTNAITLGCETCPPEYEFTVPANTTNPGTMYCYCLDVIDTNGCHAQGVICMNPLPLPKATVYDTACIAYELNDIFYYYDPTLADENGLVHYEFDEVTYDGGSNGCDSITTHKVTLIGNPTITGNLDNAYCEGTTVANLVNSLTIAHAIDTVVYINGVMVTDLSQPFAYSYCQFVDMDVKAISGSYTIHYSDGTEYNDTCYVVEPYHFIVNAKPTIEDLVLSQDAYCAKGNPVTNTTPASECKYCTVSGLDILPANCALTLVVLNEDQETVYETLGTISYPDFSWTPRLRYDGKYLAVIIENSCGKDTTSVLLDIDSTTISVLVDEYCEGEAINFDAALGKHYDPANVTAYLLHSGVKTTYTPGDLLTLSDQGAGLYFEVTGGVCDPIITDTVYLTINPKPTVTLSVNDDLCLADAATTLAGAMTVTDADNQGWINYSADPTYFEGFESGSIPATWTTVDLDGDGENWVISSDLSNVHSGSYATISYSYNLGYTYEPDNWLITPAISVTEPSVFSYFIANYMDYYPEKYSVYVLTSNSFDASAIPAPVLTEIPSSVWTQKVVDLTPYLNSTIYIAFRNYDTYDQWRLMLDDIAVYPLVSNVEDLVDAIKDEPEAEIGYFVSNECGASVANKTVRILEPLTLEVSPVTVCPNVTVANVLDAANIQTDQGNYLDSEVTLEYKVGSTVITNPTTTLINSLINSGESITVNFKTVDGVLSCGNASAPIVVTFKTFEQVNPTYKAACAGNNLSAFVETEPSYSTTSTMTVTSSNWIVKDELGTEMNVTDYNNFPIASGYSARYIWHTDCDIDYYSPWFELTVNDIPDITVTGDITRCVGESVSEADVNALVNIVYHGNESAYSKSYQIAGTDVTFPHQFDEAGTYTLTLTLVDNGQGCGNNSEDITITVNPLPEVTITGPAKACDGDNVTFVASPYDASYTYNFSIQGNFSNQVLNNNELSMYVHANGVEFTTVSVSVTDANGCSSASESSASVRVTDKPEFIFYNEDGTVNAEHAYTGETSVGLNYGWQINTNCDKDDKLVYVEYDIYYNGQLISNNAIGEYFATSTYTDQWGDQHPYVSSNSFHWWSGSELNGNGTYLTNTSYYNYAVANPTTATAGNHFPNTNLGLSQNNVYDDLWMHFIGDRKVDATLVPFRRGDDGVYKIVYRLYMTTHEDNFMHIYYEDNYHMDGIYYQDTAKLGGQNALVHNAAHVSLLVTDSILITVTGTYYTPPTSQPEIEVAPVLTPEETTVTPDMEVWPNPASAATTTLKARVHNLSGNATVTLTSLTGKQVYSGDTYIDNDNYYFEFNVNSLSVGSYILTVRTATDVITKKVIVTTLAK